jgi:ElaB/YqjD/DUF883 family membrane-anchored ribosome-binding protein
MLVNIKRAIKNIGKVEFFQPLYEAIVNSFQANANIVKIKFKVDENNYIISYSIEDNGEGFTDKNLESYLTLWSDLKADIGGLGSGRLLCLKVFDNIHIKSQTKDYEIEFDFNQDFNISNINEFNKIPNKSEQTYTITTFEPINKDFLSENGKEFFNLDEIKENIFIKLMPMFIRFKEENKDFKIYINEKIWLNNNLLQQQFDDLNFQIKEFEIEKDLSKFEKDNNDKNIIKYSFKLYYRLQETKNRNKDEFIQFYGASDRYITSFPSGVKIEKLPKNWSGIFCLTSKYFEENRVADSRNKFIIGLGDNNAASKENPITFPEINKKLSKVLEEILKETFPDIEDEAKNIRKKIIDKFPHLLRYVKKIDGLTLTETQILKKAEELFLKETKKTREEVEKFTKNIKEGKKNFDEKKFREITNHFTQTGVEQLADYIGYRQTIIEMLLEIYDDSVNKKIKIKEEDIHNLFMPMGKTSDDLSFHANNIWIFDDKFMSYNYAASDKIVAKIVSDVTGKSIEEIENYQRNKEPDLIMFYSDEETKYKDVLLIEFKKLNGTIDDKEKAINQINRYPRYIRENIDNIRSIYTYTILDIDKEFEDSLTKEQGFYENAFGDKDNKVSAYYKYNQAVKAHINVLSFSQLIQDAFKRNKIFLDILKQNFKG